MSTLHLSMSWDVPPGLERVLHGRARTLWASEEFRALFGRGFGQLDCVDGEEGERYKLTLEVFIPTGVDYAERAFEIQRLVHDVILGKPATLSKGDVGWHTILSYAPHTEAQVNHARRIAREPRGGA